MDKENAIILFKEQKICRTWYNDKLANGRGQIITSLYFQPVTICHGLKKLVNIRIAGLKYSNPANDNYLSSPDGKKEIEEGVA